MRRNDVVFVPQRPPPWAVQQNNLPQQEFASPANGRATSPHTADSPNPSIIVTVLVLATAVIVSASIYLLRRCVSLYRRRRSSVQVDAIASDSVRHYHHNHSNGSGRRVALEDTSLIDSLPVFTFASITGSKSTAPGDCAVCLSKFEPQDQLRLLPVCCHAFHVDCIDAWLSTNQTCPLCRSSIFVSESEVMRRILPAEGPNSASSSRSFRVEIGSISRRHIPSYSGSGSHRQSYSIGSFDYIIDEILSEVTITSTRSRSDFAAGGDKNGRLDKAETCVVAPPGETLAAEVAGGQNSWLKDYFERMVWTPSLSLSSSFRSSGRFFAGRSQRTDSSRVNESDLEASRLGGEIEEIFRWLSGV